MTQNKGAELKTDKYTIQIRYSPQAVEKKLMKFKTPNGDEFEISSDEMLSFMVNQLNMDTLAPAMVDTEKINTVEVMRQIKCTLDRDFKKGEEVRLNYVHPYPIEFAIIEQLHNLAKIEKDAPAFTLTNEYIEEAMKKIKPEQEKFVKKFYTSYKELNKK